MSEKPIPGESIPPGHRIFTITSLADQTGAAVNELLRDAGEDLASLAKHIIRTTPDKKAPVLRVGFSVLVDLRTGGAEYELRVARKTVYRSEAVLEQMRLSL